MVQVQLSNFLLALLKLKETGMHKVYVVVVLIIHGICTIVNVTDDETLVATASTTDIDCAVNRNDACAEGINDTTSTAGDCSGKFHV